MRPEDIRAFASRPRAEVERLKRRHWASVANAGGDGLTLGELIYEHALEANPCFHGDAAAREDFEHHIRLKRLLDRAQAALETR